MRKTWRDRVVGVLNILCGGLMCFGGVVEVGAYWGRETGPVIVGALGALASAGLVFSGVRLLFGSAAGGRMAAWSAAAMIPVHVAGAIPGYIGIPGAIAGILYPLVVLWTVGRAPRAPETVGTAGPENHDKTRQDGHLRSAAA